MQNLPSYLQALQAPDIGAALSANLGSAMPPHVSIEDNRFMLIDAGNNETPVPTFDPKMGPYLDACIVDVNEKMSRIYFGGDFDKKAEGVRPDCFSDNGFAPSISAGNPQSPTCSACPQAVWGSKINQNGKKVPACTQKQKIALLIPGFNVLFLLAVPPGSHGSLREYTEKCKGNNINIANLLTRIYFVSQGVLGFQPIAYIDEPTAQLRQAAYAEKKTDALVGRNDVPRPAGVLAAPTQAAAAPGVAMINGPFASPAPAAAQPTGTPTTPQGSPQWPNPSGTSTIPNTAAPTGTAATAFPSEPAPAQRRRRRTAAEMAEANGAPSAGQAPQQAPFPHPGRQTQQAPGPAFVANPPGPAAQQGSFGIAQPAAANPELAGMLDDFFKS
jgi:hypothetical protein